MNFRESNALSPDDIPLKEVAENNPAFKAIFLRLWELYEQKDVDPIELVEFFRKFQENQFIQMRDWWKCATGKAMTPEIERLVFHKPEIYAQISALNALRDYIECLAKAQKIADTLGLSNVGPLMISKKARGWSKGGNERAKQKQIELRCLQAEYKLMFNKIKTRSPNMSDHAIHKKIAAKHGKSSGHVYKILKSYKQEK
ncbi:MAG: hypothetical protein LLF94_06825 [Chlamydiales bacterium]|nr:hypothetical protein [Chlamydiales bacterium]